MAAVCDLRKFFGRVVVINLARRPERLARLRERFGDWPFAAIQRVEAVDGFRVAEPATWTKGPGAWGCMLSHRAVLRSAIAAGVSSLLVLEDDACPAAAFAQRAADFVQLVPGDWDALMLGGEHLRVPEPIAPGIVRCLGTNRTHAFALRGRIMPALLNYWHQYDTEHCDIVLASIMKHFRVYAPDPFLIGQDSGHSDISGRIEAMRFFPEIQMRNPAKAAA